LQPFRLTSATQHRRLGLRREPLHEIVELAVYLGEPNMDPELQLPNALLQLGVACMTTRSKRADGRRPNGDMALNRCPVYGLAVRSAS
jgi:hypothetical protein